MRSRLLVVGLMLAFVAVVGIGRAPFASATFSGSITYDSGWITVTGGTQAAPCTFIDIYNADVVGGWGKVTKNMKSNQFSFKCYLQIGDEATDTWFADNSKQVNFENFHIHAQDYYYIYVADAAHFRLGSCTTGTYATKNGCTLSGLSASVSVLQTSGVASTAVLEFYSTTFIFNNATFYPIGSSVKIYNSIIQNAFSTGLYLNTDIYNTYVSGGNAGLIDPQAPLNLVTVRGCTYGVFLSYVSSITARNMVMSDISFNEWQVQPATGYAPISAYVIDTSCSWSMQFTEATSALYRQYSFNLKVVENDNVGSPVSGATVKLYDNNLNLLFTETTADNGWIAENVITHTKYMQGSTTTYYPFTLEISKTGYQTTTIIDNFDQIKRSWTVALLPIPPPATTMAMYVSYFFMFGLIGGICGAMLWKKRNGNSQ